MTALKLKGHNINLTSIVIHRIVKNAGEKKSVLKIAKKEIKIGDPELGFMAEVRDSFTKRSVPTHGIFDDELAYNGFQIAISNYKQGKTSFMDFTKMSMDYYKRVIESSAPATGGFIIFADFNLTDTLDRYILVLSINNKQGYNLSEVALSIQQIKNLELNKMDLAAVINLTRWDLKESDPSVKTYLTFIRGKKKISDYFQDFIGCADKTTASESSTKLLNTIKSYVETKGWDDKFAKQITSKILDYCQEANKGKREILLPHISALFDAENPEEFLRFAVSEDFGNSEVVKYDGKVLRSLKFIDYQSEDLTLKFNKKLLGASIKVSKDKNTITISNLPEALKSQL